MLASLIGGTSLVYMLTLVVGFALSMTIAITFHEYLHAYVAYKNGDPTAKFSGRMTLNPFAHVDPIGLLVLVVFGFGWAKPVPVNPYNFKNGKKSELFVALAGIVGNLILGIFFSLIYCICNKFVASFENPQTLVMAFLNYFLYYSMAINFALAFFNLLPIYPMDGFRVVETYAKPNNSYVDFMRKYSLYVLLGLILFNVIDIYITYTAYFVIEKLQALWYLIFGLFGA